MPSNLPKVVVIWAVPSCRNAVGWDANIAPKGDFKEKKIPWGKKYREEGLIFTLTLQQED